MIGWVVRHPERGFYIGTTELTREELSSLGAEEGAGLELWSFSERVLGRFGAFVFEMHGDAELMLRSVAGATFHLVNGDLGFWRRRASIGLLRHEGLAPTQEEYERSRGLQGTQLGHFKLIDLDEDENEEEQ